jgi:hypothetical protein
MVFGRPKGWKVELPLDLSTSGTAEPELKPSAKRITAAVVSDEALAQAVGDLSARARRVFENHDASGKKRDRQVVVALIDRAACPSGSTLVPYTSEQDHKRLIREPK